VGKAQRAHHFYLGVDMVGTAQRAPCLFGFNFQTARNSTVIASAAKQSIAQRKESKSKKRKNDCFAALAMTC
jgi:hypothetical protein